jgi:hypothetical protein
MTESVQQLLDAFDSLTEAERQEAAAEILRRVRNWELPPLDDEALTLIADESFLEYDARESADPPARPDRPGTRPDPR